MPHPSAALVRLLTTLVLPLALGACVVVEAPPPYYDPGVAAGAALGGLMGAAIAESTAAPSTPIVIPYPPPK